MAYIPNALNVLTEFDITPPDEHLLIAIVEAALDARALLVAASIHVPSPTLLQLLLNSFVLFCTQVAIDEEPR
jgi:hypothetical protein